MISVWLIRYNHCIKLVKLTFFVPFTKNDMFELTKCGLSPERFLYSTQCNMDYWLKRIIAAVTGTCIFGDAATFIKNIAEFYLEIFSLCLSWVLPWDI